MKSCIAVDIGGSKMLIAEVTEDGTILNCRRYVTSGKGKEEVVRLLIQGIREYEQQVGWQNGKRPEQMGVGINGIIDPEAGLWEKIGENDTEIALRERMEQEFGVRCFVDNDVKCTVMAENIYGVGKGCRDLVYINVGTGLAAGMITNGRIIRGTDGFAGEIGFMNFTEGLGEHVEMLASGMGIRYQAKQLISQYPDSVLADRVQKGVTGQELLEAVAAQDSLAGSILDTLIRMIGLMISNLVCVLSPELVVLGGGLITDEGILERIRGAVLPKARQHLEKGIRMTGLKPEYAGLMGAAAIGHGCQEKYR